jgi:hypothetical protein
MLAVEYLQRCSNRRYEEEGQGYEERLKERAKITLFHSYCSRLGCDVVLGW